MFGAELVEVRIGIAEGLGYFIEALQQAPNLGHSKLDVLFDGQIWVQLWFLRKVAHTGAGLEPGGTIGGLGQSRHDLQYGGLSGTVVPDDSDLGVGKETEVGGLENVSARGKDHINRLHLIYKIGHNASVCGLVTDQRATVHTAGRRSMNLNGFGGLCVGAMAQKTPHLVLFTRQHWVRYSFGQKGPKRVLLFASFTSDLPPVGYAGTLAIHPKGKPENEEYRNSQRGNFHDDFWYRSRW